MKKVCTREMKFVRGRAMACKTAMKETEQKWEAAYRNRRAICTGLRASASIADAKAALKSARLQLRQAAPRGVEGLPRKRPLALQNDSKQKGPRAIRLLEAATTSYLVGNL